jgi:prolyl 4-hydroxylase
MKPGDKNWFVMGGMPYSSLPLRPTKIEIEDDKLDICVIDNFVTAKECEVLSSVIKEKAGPSRISVAGKPGHHVDDDFRSSSTCSLSEISLGRFVDARILAYMGIHPLFSESLEGQYYKETQEFKPHTDTFAPGSDEFEKHAKISGQRTWTFMVYLEEPDEGGETQFHEVNWRGNPLKISPVRGRAIAWNNLHPDGSINHSSIHSGCPVIRGEKTIVTKWFRTKRFVDQE